MQNCKAKKMFGFLLTFAKGRKTNSRILDIIEVNALADYSYQ